MSISFHACGWNRGDPEARLRTKQNILFPCSRDIPAEQMFDHQKEAWWLSDSPENLVSTKDTQSGGHLLLSSYSAQSLEGSSHLHAII